MIIHVQYGFNQLYSISNKTMAILDFLICIQNTNFLLTHSINIHNKFDCNLPIGSGEEI